MPATAFSCPRCAAILQVAAPLPAGQSIQCPQCRTVIVPGPAAVHGGTLLEAAPDFAAALRAGRPAPAVALAPAAWPPRPPSVRKGGPGLLIGLIGGGIAFALFAFLAIVLVIVGLVWQSKATKETAVADLATTSEAAPIERDAKAQPRKPGVLDLLETPGAFDQPPPAAVPPPGRGRPEVPPERRPGPPAMPRPPRLPRDPAARRPMLAGWQPELALLRNLDPVTALGEYRIRPPRGYGLERRVKNGGEFFVWKGAARDDGNAPQLLLTVLPVPPEGRDTPAEPIFDAILEACKKGQTTLFPVWNAGAHESGSINGIPFLRARISGGNGPVRMAGFAYLALDSGKVLFFLSQDVAPYDGDTLRVTEASTLTLRR